MFASALPGMCRRAPSPGEAILASDTGAGLCRTDKIDEAVICSSVCSWMVENVVGTDDFGGLFWG